MDEWTAGIIGISGALLGAIIGAYLGASFEARVRWKNRPRLELNLKKEEVGGLIYYDLRMTNHGKTTARYCHVWVDFVNSEGRIVESGAIDWRTNLSVGDDSIHPGETDERRLAFWVVKEEYLEPYASRTRVSKELTAFPIVIKVTVRALDMERATKEFTIEDPRIIHAT